MSYTQPFRLGHTLTGQSTSSRNSKGFKSACTSRGPDKKFNSNGHSPTPLEGSSRITRLSSDAGKPSGNIQPKNREPKIFKNKNRYVVPMDVLEPFETEWRFREVNMQKVDGFLGLEVERLDGQYVVESTWKSIPAWEKWSCCDVARRSHLPVGVFQFVPPRGEGFPEDFVPFQDLTQSVNAKYLK